MKSKCKQKVDAGRTGGSRRSPRKRRAAKSRFRRIALGTFISWLSQNSDAMDHPDLAPVIDSLIELLVARKLAQLGLTPEIPA